MHNCSKKHLIFVLVSYMIHLMYGVCINLLFCRWGGSHFFYLSFWKVNFFKPSMVVSHNFLAELFLTLVPPPPVNINWSLRENTFQALRMITKSLEWIHIQGLRMKTKRNDTERESKDCKWVACSIFITSLPVAISILYFHILATLIPILM